VGWGGDSKGGEGRGRQARGGREFVLCPRKKKGKSTPMSYHNRGGMLAMYYTAACHWSVGAESLAVMDN